VILIAIRHYRLLGVQVTSSRDGVQASVGAACPFVVIEVCETCWRFHGVITEENGKHSGSQSWKHNWKNFSTFLLLPSRQTVSNVPQQVAEKHEFVMCYHAHKKRGCTYRYHTGRQCKFAHSSDEIEVWKWMLNNDGKHRLCHSKILYQNYILIQFCFCSVFKKSLIMYKTEVTVCQLLSLLWSYREFAL